MLNNKGHVLSFNDSPISQNSPLDSIAYNKIIDSLKSSTLRCINRSRDLTDRLVKMNKALSAENLYLSSQVKKQTLAYENNSVEANTVLITGFDLLEANENAVQDPLTGQIIILPNNKWSKVVRYLDRNGRNRASKDIQISLDGNIQPTGSDIYSILDGYNDTFWLLETQKGNTHTIRITFPASIKPYVNYLSLIPFPAFGYSINKVDIMLADGTRQPLADLTSKEMGILDMHFKPITWGGVIEIQITSNGDIIGISDLDIGLEDYYQDAGDDNPASFVFEVPALRDMSFNRIEYVDLSMCDLYGIGKDSSYIKTDKINVYVQHGTSYSKTGTWKHIDSTTTQANKNTNVVTGQGFTNLDTPKTSAENFYVKFTLKKHLGQTPIFKATKIKFGTGA